MKSKIFTDIENQFAQAGELTILETAHQALDDLVKVLTDYDDRTLFAILIHAAKLGVSGDGVVNKKVLENCGIDPEEYSGIAFGIGIERIAMLKYGIDHMGLLFENNIDFLKQFKA